MGFCGLTESSWSPWLLIRCRLPVKLLLAVGLLINVLVRGFDSYWGHAFFSVFPLLGAAEEFLCLLYPFSWARNVTLLGPVSLAVPSLPWGGCGWGWGGWQCWIPRCCCWVGVWEALPWSIQLIAALWSVSFCGCVRYLQHHKDGVFCSSCGGCDGMLLICSKVTPSLGEWSETHSLLVAIASVLKKSIFPSPQCSCVCIFLRIHAQRLASTVDCGKAVCLIAWMEKWEDWFV